MLPDSGFFALSGLEQLRAYLDRRLPSTPHAHLLGYRLTQASPGTVVFSMPVSPWFEIYDGFIDLAALAELSVKMAALTVAPPASELRTVTLSVRYLRPCTIDDESVTARGRVVHAGSNFTTVEAVLEDRLGRAVAHASGCVLSASLDPAPTPLPYGLEEPVDDPVYPTPDPVHRKAPASGSAGGLVPAFGALLGMQVLEASETRVVATLSATEWFCLLRREVEAGILCTLGNLTAAVINHQMVGPNERAVTFETATSFLTAVPADGRLLTATAELRAKVGEVFVLGVDVVDADGQQVLLGGGTLLSRVRRSRPVRRPSNRVLLTVLFTDVVGSTERVRGEGDSRWNELLATHNDVVRRQIESHRGREVKTMGDGFLITFESPSSAVQCARAIRDGLERLGLQIRAGIHTGECELVGRDVAGLAVHVAARVQAAAEPREILVSSTVRDLLAGSGLSLVDRGTFELKGLEGRWSLSAVED